VVLGYAPHSRIQPCCSRGVPGLAPDCSYREFSDLPNGVSGGGRFAARVGERFVRSGSWT